jgi:AcrR family transcriptional regulator
MADLDLQRITEAAMRVADRDGPEGFTMRAVADELGVTSTALYRHVDDKRQLISLLVDAVVTEQPLPVPTGDWLEDLWQMARTMRAMTHAHPAVSELRRGQQIWSTAVLPITERWMNLWAQSGLPLHAALRGAVATSLAITGIVDEELMLRNIKLPEESALTWVPNARLAFDLERDVDDDFELVARSLIEGVYARLAAEADEASAS